MKDLDPKSTFDSFVVGPANRLASAAAKRAAESPGTAYNPLFIYSASGLGKSHILMAVAHHAQQSNPDFRVRYQTLEGFLQALEAALEAGDRDAFRDQYREVDILLMDDVQFLAGQAQAQEILLATLDALTAAESQIVLASDRPPAEIDGLDARLVSRFSGGLIVDISPPELETRTAIILKKVRERGQSLEAGVAEAIARFPFRNIRELGGALNRVIATQELEDRRLAAEDIPDLIGEAVGVEPESEPSDDDDVFGALVEAVALEVEAKEPPWRRRIREVVEAAERDGFATARIRTLLDGGEEPEAWGIRLDGFGEDIARLREIDRELDRLGNPWPDAATALLRDPDRLPEAEAFLASVRERVRPFLRLVDGPTLDDLGEDVPVIAVRAAAQVVGGPRPQYSPLYLWSRDTNAALGLLAAAGRSYAADQPDERVAVTSIKEFADDFVRALGAGVAGAWRERWWTVDLLLVHGMQALSGTERAQDEFFHLYEALKRRGSRVILAADRPPSEIGAIDERLRSRFEGGLVLQITGGDGEGSAPLRISTPSVEEAVESESASSWASVTRTVEADHAAGASTRARKEVAAGPAAPPGVAAAWRPSREKVVWVWPSVADRLVEDLD
jgi:chromosomal replication initiation ATPase DnaA